MSRFSYIGLSLPQLELLRDNTLTAITAAIKAESMSLGDGPTAASRKAQSLDILERTLAKINIAIERLGGKARSNTIHVAYDGSQSGGVSAS